MSLRCNCPYHSPEPFRPHSLLTSWNARTLALTSIERELFLCNVHELELMADPPSPATELTSTAAATSAALITQPQAPPPNVLLSVVSGLPLARVTAMDVSQEGAVLATASMEDST
jgi:hypothetical protein